MHAQRKQADMQTQADLGFFNSPHPREARVVNVRTCAKKELHCLSARQPLNAAGLIRHPIGNVGAIQSHPFPIGQYGRTCHMGFHCIHIYTNLAQIITPIPIALDCSAFFLPIIALDLDLLTEFAQ